MEIEQRLGLYQIFLKLYEHHRGLLDEILQLEKTGSKTVWGVATQSITGIIDGQQAYIITNLVDGETQTLFQNEGIWTIGRDRQMALTIQDRRLSRRHAVIQYVKHQGFYLVDLNSTNGSFVNGEPVHGRTLLRDGDRIRLSCITFSFFLCHTIRTLEDIPQDILSYLQGATVSPEKMTKLQNGSSAPSVDSKDKEETLNSMDEEDELEDADAEFSLPHLSQDKQSEILDRFFSLQIHKVSGHN
ncbi:MAG: FHA domain-containing protein [Coleofasciculaceae cyanobacterium]